MSKICGNYFYSEGVIDLKFEHTEVFNFKGALRGMRNPMNSWNKSDSECLYHMLPNYSPDDENAERYDKWNREFGLNLKIGEKDLALAQKLIRAGSEHRKFMRQIFVCVDITAPLYWWKEFDTYKVGTVANSTSTMHKLASTPITLECFDIDDYKSKLEFVYDLEIEDKISIVLHFLEKLRQKYLETKDKRYWKELIRWLPESWLQTRTVTLNYENLLAICSKGQRRFHKLNEWSGADNPELPNFISWARTLPYAQELIFIDEVSE